MPYAWMPWPWTLMPYAHDKLRWVGAWHGDRWSSRRGNSYWCLAARHVGYANVILFSCLLGFYALAIFLACWNMLTSFQVDITSYPEDTHDWLAPSKMKLCFFNEPSWSYRMPFLLLYIALDGHVHCNSCFFFVRKRELYRLLNKKITIFRNKLYTRGTLLMPNRTMVRAHCQ